MPISDSQPRGLYMPDGSFKRFDAESLATELATRQNAGDLFSFVAGSLGILPDPDPILRARGDEASVLEDLAADDQVTTAMLNRKYRVLNQRDYAFSPGAAGKKEADGPARLLCDRLIQDMERWTFTDILSGILDAPFYGFTPLELIWKPEDRGAASASWWRLADIIARPPGWFGFNDKNEPVWRGANMGTATPLPPGKFIFARHFPTYKNPYGLRLLSRCLWPVAFKKGGIQFYVNFVEKYGTPWAIGTAPAKAERQEKRDMAQDLARMVQDAVAVIPAGAKVELVTSAGQVGDLHERFLKRWDASISKVLMGQTLTAELDGQGSYAAAETHKGVANDMAEADRRLVESCCNEIAWIYGQINQPGALAPVFGYAENEDKKERASLDESLARVGVVFTSTHFERVYGMDPSEFTVTRPTSQGNTGWPGLSFSSPEKTPVETSLHNTLAVTAQTAMDKAIDKALPKALEAGADFCSHTAQRFAGAQTFEDGLRIISSAMRESGGPKNLEEMLSTMMFSAACLGHASVTAEAEEDA